MGLVKEKEIIWFVKVVLKIHRQTNY